jgi:hypothetical protein
LHWGSAFSVDLSPTAGETIENVFAAAFLIDSGDLVCSLDGEDVIMVERGDPSTATVVAFKGPCWAQP